MVIAGVGSYNYTNYYQNNVNRHSEQASSTFGTSASKGIELHMTDGEGTKALTSVGFHNGTSASVFKADNYTEENPQYLVKYWDEKGEIQEYTVNPKEVDPESASYIEMLAYSTYSDVQGYTTDAYANFMSAAGGTSADIEYDSTNINEKKNFKSMVQDFMQMQYDAGNISGYLSYKQFYDYMDGTDSKKDYSKFLEQYAEQIKEKIKNGETEPTFQIGGQSFTEEEWKKLVEKIDKDIEKIQAEQAERLEKQKAEQTNTDTASSTNSDVAGITRYYNGKEVNYEEDMLHDRKMYDAETGVTWYLNDERGPYMSGEDSEKFDKWCEDNGVDKLKKFAEMTGLIRNYSDGTTAYVGDNGIAVKGTDGTEFVVEYSNVSWYALMDAVDQMQGSPLDKQTWNKVMQDYAENKVEESEVTETQIQELLKDNNERRFESYGPNAPEEVKQAWMNAAEETGLNGLGMNAGGQMSHITQLDVQRVIKWYNGENPDVLGTTVDSARQAVEKALYDLEHPLEPLTNRSASVQKSIEKEKEFYKAFLENLSV